MSMTTAVNRGDKSLQLRDNLRQVRFGTWHSLPR
jgi:hypothetical protein